MEPCTKTAPRSRVVLLFFFVALSSPVSFSSSFNPVFLAYFCPNTTVFKPNSIYHSEVSSILSSLSSNADSDFYNMCGDGNVFGSYYCRGDVTSDVCGNCVETAANNITQYCPYEKTAYIYYDACTFVYSNQSFFSSDFQALQFSMWNTQNVSDPTRFNQILGNTIKNVTTVAASNPKKFATQEANISQFQEIYCLAQCRPYLLENDCSKCFSNAIEYLSICCAGKEGGRAYSPNCNIRYEIYPFYQLTASASAPSPIFVSPPLLINRTSGKASAHPPSIFVSPPLLNNRTSISEKRRSLPRKITIVVLAAAAGVILFSIVLYCLLIQKKKEDRSKDNGLNAIKNAESLQFDFSRILAATNNFVDVNKIGEGGFGSVYVGKLPNGQEIAVKRLSRNSGQGATEFKNEVVLVAKLQHCNLARLLGFCLEGEEKILIYEFVPNKSLDYFLFDPEKRLQLDWSGRYKIIGGIARGLLYLHEDSRLRIIHRDLKASNVLLDGDMNPKISDFGLARSFGVDQIQASTNRIVGTYGYMSPEYAMHGQFSVKSDVFSFGVLVLEIISGKKNSSFYQPDNADNLISYAWRHWNAGTAYELIDSILKENCSRSEIMRCIHIGLLCVQEDVADRPTMANIVLMLNNYSGNRDRIGQHLTTPFHHH
ncbi:hypothetical protein NE237_001539 [Protea cynaroides]|uniref:Cysteine-rich receptor-like protein kinase 10 n=1 Tax=Protea cynaroides TaxID=273540 RepID=A0A9Q0KTA9_9MAGN|nr:hypothetical protein NE237_001539 [Protea cynaroides]